MASPSSISSTRSHSPASRALAQLPAILRKLHALPPFPKTFNYVTAHNGIIWRFRESNLLPVPEIEEVFTHYGRLCAAYPRLDADMGFLPPRP